MFSAAWLEPMAEVLRNLGSERVWIAHGSDGLDEITTTGPTQVVELKDGAIRAFDVDAGGGRAGRAEPAALKGGDPAHNAEALRAVLGGAPRRLSRHRAVQRRRGPGRGGQGRQLEEGVARGAAAIDSGAARGDARPADRRSNA